MPITPAIQGVQVTGTGCVLSIGGKTGATGTEMFTVVGGLSDFKRTGVKMATTPVTNFASLGIAQKLNTILDLGMITGTVQRISNDAGQLAVIAALSAGGNYDFKLQLPINTEAGQSTTGDSYTFFGIVTEANAFDVSLSKVSEWSLTVDLNGLTFTAGS